MWWNTCFKNCCESFILGKYHNIFLTCHLKRVTIKRRQFERSLVALFFGFFGTLRDLEIGSDFVAVVTITEILFMM